MAYAFDLYIYFNFMCVYVCMNLREGIITKGLVVQVYRSKARMNGDLNVTLNTNDYCMDWDYSSVSRLYLACVQPLGFIVYACNPGVLEVETEGSEIQGHPWLWSEFKAILEYTLLGAK